MMRYFPVFFCLCLYSCLEKEVAYELPFEGEKIVVEGVIFPNVPLQLRLYKTFDPLAPYIDIRVTEAEIELLENGQTVDQLIFQAEPNSLFQGSLYWSADHFLPNPLSVYEIRISAPNLPPAHSQPARFPTAPLIEYFQAGLDTIASLIRLNARLNLQNIHPENAYWIQVSAWYQLSADQPDTLIDVFTIPISGTQLQSGQANYNLEKINMTYNLQGEDNMLRRLSPRNEIILKAIAFSPEYKNYLEDVDNFNSEIGGFFPGASQVRSNIKGGYGVFGTANLDTVIIKL